MGKIMVKAALAFLLTVLFASSVYAKTKADEEIFSVHINIDLQQDGTAYITEAWDVTVYSGTEWYLVQGSLGAIDIKDFAVQDESGEPYLFVEDWDVDASLSQKAGKCGIVDAGSHLELCWGKGSFGRHTYTASYTMTNFVKHYSDGFYGFNQRVLNDELSSAPQETTVTISVNGKTLTEDDTKIWAFGYVGEIYVTDGQIRAYSTEALNSASYVTILARFDESLFESGYETTQTFEDVRDTAMIDSDYDQRKAEVTKESSQTSYTRKTRYFSTGLMYLIVQPAVLLFPFVIFLIIRRRQRAGSGSESGSSYEYNRPQPPPLEYWRESPGDMAAAWHVAGEFGLGKTYTRLISAFLLHWYQTGDIRIDSQEKNGFLGLSKKDEVTIYFNSTTINEPLFKMLLSASKNGVLTDKAFYKWAKNHYSSLSDWADIVAYTGKQNMIANGGIEKITVPYKGLFGKERYRTVYEYSQEGLLFAARVKGFKKYLKDYTLINERRAVDVHLWKEFLEYACLYGIADEVARQFKELYPQFFSVDVSNHYAGMGSSVDIITTLTFVDHMVTTAYRGAQEGRAAAASASSSSDGGGGSSSSGGGGGGSSGGGSGGGSR